MNLKKCRAIVSGGSSGLGKAVVEAILSNGGKVVIFDQDLTKKVKEQNNSFSYKVDVSDEQNVEDSIKLALKALGGTLNVLVNCAGIGIINKVLDKKRDLLLKSFRRMIDVNLVGTFNMIQAAVVEMLKNEIEENGERGVIINTSSIAAFEGQSGQVGYSASKAGIVGMTLPLARELSSFGIRVMAIAPGIFDTPILKNVPLKHRDLLEKSVPFPSRLGKPEEFAELVLFIIKQEMFNGTTLRFDGALRLSD